MGQWLSERQRDGGIDAVPLPPDVPGELLLCGKRAIADGRFAHPSMPWTTVVCLCQRHELAGRYPGYVDWLDDPESNSIWWPVHDLGAASVGATLPFIDGLAARLRAGETLLVHCAAGIGRAGTTAVCILVRLGVPIDDALATVRDSRAMAGPEAGAQLMLVREIAAAT
ncbi:protein-tyrosine phosphatase family protein [Ilumatobacter sp.]|uniref:protein-tyrosine phosphatase family protein n=1 Tax=Ilumatobacter sp. TaxID=1967498 RepID=UPI003AF99D4C